VQCCEVICTDLHTLLLDYPNPVTSASMPSGIESVQSFLWPFFCLYV
jgi:hypothetical protein